MVSFNPNLIMVSSIKAHHTNRGINQHGTFSVNYPTAEQVAETDYCGTKSGKNTDKSKLFTNFYGVLESAPMIMECPVNLECRVIDTHQYGANETWVAEVVETYIDETIVPDDPKKWPTIEQVNPLVYSPASEYYRLGIKIGEGYREGLKITAPR